MSVYPPRSPSQHMLSSFDNSKSSISYILSPPHATSSTAASPMTAAPTASTSASGGGAGGEHDDGRSLAASPSAQAAALPSTPPSRVPPFARLPAPVVSRIAFHLVTSDARKHPARLLPLMQTSRAAYAALRFDDNFPLYNALFRATFDYAALDRRYEWMVANLADVAGRGRNMFDLFSNPRSWAIDYRTRWELARHMRQVVAHGRLGVDTDRDAYATATANASAAAAAAAAAMSSSASASSVTSSGGGGSRAGSVAASLSGSATLGAAVAAAPSLAGDLWNIWFLLTENDGRNLPFLRDECRFDQWIVIYYRDDMLRDSMVPGYPRETGEKALATWCALLSDSDHSVELTPGDVDEKIFILRPFVFACAKYDITYAPWHHARLPLCEAGCTQHEPDVTLRSKALPYNRFGYRWRRAPPHFVLGAILVFMRLLERQSARAGLKPGSSSRFADSASGLFASARIMPSVYHDREWQRNSVCQDPHTSPGLPPTTFVGEIAGFWRGKFLFYDFEAYRRILAGNMRGVYTGTFAEQVAEMELKETLVRVRKTDVGGPGPMLCAGFLAEGGDEAEQTYIESGYGRQIVGAEEPDEDGWTKEILISGRCRTSWGWANVRGRVRSWDGLVVIAISYSRHAMGRWLWRGYLHTGGYLIGRWRDTFTDENLRGYEGAFGMVRAGDLFYPSSFPTRMADSLGVNSDAGPPAGGIAGRDHGADVAEASGGGAARSGHRADPVGGGDKADGGDGAHSDSQSFWPSAELLSQPLGSVSLGKRKLGEAAVEDREDREDREGP